MTDQLDRPAGEEPPTPSEAEIDAVEGLSVEPITQWDLFRSRFARHRLAMIGALVLGIWVLLAIFADLLPLESPTDIQFAENGRPFVRTAPRSGFPLGTDDVGRDVLARLIYGGRASLLVGGVVGFIVATFGTLVGSIAGFYPGPIDQALMRLVDLVLGLPLLPVAIVVGRVLPEISFLPVWLKDGPVGLALLLGLLSWGTLARIVRAEFLSLREKEFVEAARAAGANDRRIVFRHILPNAMSPIIVQTTLIIGAAIIIEAALSFLGFGIVPPTPTWGSMVSDGGRMAVRGEWWLLTFSGIALVTTVLAINFLGDGLRDALDPKQTIDRR